MGVKLRDETESVTQFKYLSAYKATVNQETGIFGRIDKKLSTYNEMSERLVRKRVISRKTKITIYKQYLD